MNSIQLLIAVWLTLWLVIIYHHLVYPKLLSRLASNKRQADKPQQQPSDQAVKVLHSYYYPQITMVIPAYNEAAYIGDKIRNIASLDYPEDKLSVLIICDGCSDNTAQLARQTLAEAASGKLNAKVIEQRENIGKVAIINSAVAGLDSEIVALSDASALISMDALKLAAEAFHNSQTGFVAARYQLLTPGSKGEQSYWNYQSQIKRDEARLGDPIGVHGALYFFRRKLFKPLPADTINDDFILPMKIVASGSHGVYLEDIVSTELETASSSDDQRRRVRIGAGNLQQLVRLSELLNPRYGGTAFTFASGKGLRALMPSLLALQLLLSLLIGPSNPWMAAFAALQLLGISFAALCPRLPKSLVPHPLQSLCYFVNGYRTCLLGTLRYLVGLERGRWRSVNR